MKRYLIFVVFVGIVVLSLTACARSATSRESISTTEMNASNGAASTEKTENSSATTKLETTASTETSVDNSITLESVKQAALDAGYAAEDMQEIYTQTEPIPIRGIYLNYADDNLQSQCPVYEFKDAADAREFAKQVNDSGYSLCIIQDKLLAMTDAKYGIILHDKEKSVLESFLQSSFLPYEEPTLPPISLDKDYAGAASRIEAIRLALDKLVNKSVTLYAKSLPADDPGTINFLSLNLVGSSDLSFTAPLSEEQAKIDSVIQTWELYGCTDVKIKHDKPHDYTMTGKRAGMEDPFSIHCVYSPEQDSVSLVDVNGKELVEFFEFVPLGNDQYAFQTLHERAVLTYQDGEITSLAYSLKPRTIEFAYNPETDNIYPSGKGADEAWVKASGEDTFEQLILCNGTKLQISAVDFTGSKVVFEMEVQ